LLDFVEARAAELASPGARVGVPIPEKATDLRDALESRGFSFRRFSFRMTASLDREPTEPEWPEGISVRPFRDDDARAVFEVQEETFSDLDDHSPLSYDDWSHWSFRDGFDPGLWFLAEAGGELQGIVLCRPEWDGDSTFGWVSVLGVRRPWRGRGLGLALLRHAFRQLRARGKTRVGLGVDSRNATGAVRLYERAGMEVARRRLTYTKEFG
jgi:mycothiol synthase